MVDIVIDIEANGFNPDVIHCVSVMKTGWEKPILYTEREHFLGFLNANKGATVYAHNGVCYDFPHLANLWRIDWSDFVLRDTLVLSRLANPSRGGGHSLENWGLILGFPKDDYEGGWEVYTHDMGQYCLRDSEVLWRALRVIQRELGTVIDSDAVRLEQQVAPIIRQQIDNGWLIDERRCYDLLAELRDEKDEAETEVHRRFRPLCTKVREISPKYKKDGQMSVVGIKFYGDNATRVVGGRFTRVNFPEFNLGSRQQIGNYLQRFGWKPRKYTETGQPVVSEEELENIHIPEAQLIARYLMLEKRAAMVNSWLDGADENGYVHGYVNPIGAVTGRMTHSSPNVAQVTADGKPYGAELRKCWTVPRGYKLVGMDADGLELRMLAHYMNDKDYIKAVVNGRKEDKTDAHSVNQRAAGLATRDQAKVFIYAFLYGAGDGKIGSIVGQSKSAGRSLKAKFLRATPALGRLKKRVSQAARRGWLQGLDGRRIIVRSEHAALNSLLQGAGAVVMKEALVLLDLWASAEGLDYKFVGNIHDEVQAQVHERDAERFAELAEAAMVQAGKNFNLRCPLAGTAVIGTTWYDTH